MNRQENRYLSLTILVLQAVEYQGVFNLDKVLVLVSIHIKINFVTEMGLCVCYLFFIDI